MTIQERFVAEAEAAQFIVDTLTAGRPNLSALLAAGACLKASVWMAMTLDEENYPRACRAALENILNDLNPPSKHFN